jgi:hypothetical protein
MRAASIEAPARRSLAPSVPRVVRIFAHYGIFPHCGIS